MDSETFFKEFRKAVSHERLDKYGQRGAKGGDANLIVHYAWNIALAESLYPTLQFLEVILRNSIHDALTDLHKTEAWWDTPGLLHNGSLDDITKAQTQIRREKKPVTEGAIVATLTFGFWTGLFSARYEPRIWNRINKKVFPGYRRYERNRGQTQRLLNRLRIFRNRVFHHEPIWYLRSLGANHQDILRMIEIMRPGVLDYVRHLDRFPALYGSGMSKFQEDLEAKMSYLVPPSET